MTQTVRKVAIVGANRIPFARSNRSLPGDRGRALAELTPMTLPRVNFRPYYCWCNLLPSGAVHPAPSRYMGYCRHRSLYNVAVLNPVMT